MKDGSDPVERVEISGEMDAHRFEAFKLEVRQLAKRLGIDLEEPRAEAGSNDPR